MELKWDLSQLYSSEQGFLDDVINLKELAQKILTKKGTLNSKQSVLEYFCLAEQIASKEEKIYCYLFFKKSLDGSDVFAIEKLAELEAYFQDYSKQTTFVMQELKKIPNKTLIEWSGLKEFSKYDNELKEIIKQKKHTLPQTQEKIMIGASFANAQREIMDCLDNVEIKFGKIKDEQGNSVELTQSNYTVFANSHIKSVRKSAKNKFYKAYGALNQTISANFISHIKYSSFVAKTYKYKNTLDMCLKDEDLPANLPRYVVKNVNKYLPFLHRYYSWRKSFMNLERFESCDLSCKLFDKSVSPEYSLEEGVKIVKNALSPLGEEYTNMLDHAVKHDWIDSRVLKNKDSGAYSANVFGVHPFILLTFDKTQNSVSTLAHEFGHAMHSFYSEKTQPYTKHDPEIFVAEVASTVNEILLAEYLISNAKNSKQKIAHITELLTTFIATVFVQTQYTEFELFVHDSVDKGEPLSYKKLNNFYLTLQKKYCGEDVHVLPETQYHWSIVPHFYRDFYVFKYATGFVSACAIVSKLKEDPTYVQKYIKFLSAGSSLEPCDILKIADVDILDEKTYVNAFKLFENYLQILENTKE